MKVKFDTIRDAETAFTDDGWFEAANYEMKNEIVEYMFRNDVDLETALDDLDAWGEA